MAKQKVALLYGIGEGDYHGRAFVHALQNAGFEVVRDTRAADIVITHSGGCFFLPPLNLNQKFVLIDPPYWPGKSLLVSTLQKVVRDFRDYAKDGLIVQWLWKTVMNIVHLIRYAVKTTTIIQQAHKQRFYEAVRDETTIIVRNDADPFLAPNADKLLEQNVGRVMAAFYHVPDQHDSCWRFPEPYVRIINAMADKEKL